MSQTEDVARRCAGQRSLRDLLSHDRIVIPLPAGSLAAALDALGHAFPASTDAEGSVRADLETLDRSRIVPLGERAVLVHLRSDRSEAIEVAIGVAEAPLAFAPETARGARVLILVVSPRASTRAYLQTLGALGRVLRRRDVTARLAGAGSPRDIMSIPALAEPILGPDLLVRDVMTADVLSVRAEASLAEVADLMVERRLRALPVVSEEGEVVGMITDRQVMEHFLPRIGGAEDVEGGGKPAPPARDVMHRSVLCVKEDERVRDVAALMINKDVERFPVCAEGCLVGFLTRGDIIRKLLGRSPE